LVTERRRIAALLEYDGSAFNGWQFQTNGVGGIQKAVEAALSAVANEPVSVICAGRTDTGVHATAQVIHFETRACRTPHSWICGANRYLPDTVALHWAGEVPENFHARYSAEARSYCYLILNQMSRPGMFGNMQTWWHRPLDAERMHAAAQSLLGEQDFSALRARGCQSSTPWRFVESVQVHRHGDRILLKVTANAFVYHMIRNIVGTLLPIGEGQKPVSWMAEVLATRDRRCAGITAPSRGLYFTGVRYPREFALPSDTISDRLPLLWNSS
jgi:tRNA pseudouridine38-40 synthase